MRSARSVRTKMTMLITKTMMEASGSVVVVGRAHARGRRALARRAGSTTIRFWEWTWMKI
jgi:hypothetical protein